ncbi:ribonuclease I [Gluconacetobacter johannae DSM 13595]|uniref:Ribonuclease I n=1 Tax=Gluconacetobacter johannae TaxID=112140 RepID=A0A7W4J6N3_9PROT|nr:ribonuclease I [Gluconacetobacter johannae]MBB2175675.1 ribonuclease I [Gluconacetobacter johannae]GBQ83281.1 ribonuclease I [Gluconacetobacter johannae DSM 13595]
MFRHVTGVALAAVLTLGLAACAPRPVPSPLPEATRGLPALQPSAHGDFGHYTLALTWQPGFCASGPGCLADQPKAPLIGLHGLWASRPRKLIEQGVTPPQWWAAGCDIYPGQDRNAPIVLTDGTRRALGEAVAHLHDDLVTHEYRKHVQCFGMPAESFFRTALAMRATVADSPLAAYLGAHIGQDITHDALLDVFRRTFGTDVDRALQIHCETDHGRTILTQLWFTIRTGAVASFPRPESFMRSPEPQDNCPARFTVPDWPRLAQ